MKSKPRKGRSDSPSPRPEAVASPALSTAGARPRHGLILAGIWALLLLANINSFRDGFPFDNRAAILTDARVHAATSDNIHQILTQDYWPKQPANLYRPLTTLSYLFNYAILGNGANPAGYHWFNLLLHMFNAGLVYALGLLLMRERMWAAAAAATWAVHPLLTESITNIVGRADLLAGLGVLGGLLCYILSTRAEGLARFGWLAGAGVVTGIGMFSKESAIVVLAAMLVYDVAFPDAAPSWSRRIPGYAAVGAGCLVYLYARHTVLGPAPPIFFPFPDNPLVGADFLTARMTALKVLGKYLWLLVWPARLSCEYSYNQIPLFGWHLGSLEDWKALIGLAWCLALGAFGIWCYRRNRVVFFCIGFFFATLAPTSNIFMLAGTIMAERFLYVPAIAFAILLVVAVRAASVRFSRRGDVALAILAVLCLAFAVRTFVRNFDWYDDETLYGANVISCPRSFKSHNGLAVALAIAKPPQLDRAAAEMDRSLEILSTIPDDRNESPPYAMAGYVYRRKGESEPAPQNRQWVEKSVQALSRGAAIDAAASRATIQAAAARGIQVLRGGWAPLYLELGKSYLDLGEPARALASLQYGRIIEPDQEFFEEMSRVYRVQGDNEKAAIVLLEGIGMNSQFTRLGRQLVTLYRETAPQSCALNQTETGAGLNVNCPMVHTQICQATRNVSTLYNELGKPDQAVSASNAALSMGCR
jgi:tetratricopeptide (TPR) repeat protein